MHSGACDGCLIDNNLANNGPRPARQERLQLSLRLGVTGAGSPIPNEFYITGTPISAQTGTKAYCAFDDGVVRTQPAGTITLSPATRACQALFPMAN